MQPSQPAAQPTFSGTRVLVVDDEQAMRRTLSGFFTHLGYQVIEAESGAQALQDLERQHFDVVLLDLKMPGMDGTELLQAARPLAPNTVFIILTAYGTLDSAIAAIRCGAYDYLLKPTPIREIARAVESGLAARRRAAGPGDAIALLEQALVQLKTSQPQPTVPAPGERFLQAAGITIDLYKRLVVAGSQTIDVTPTELDLVTYLIKHQERVVSYRELAAHVYGLDLNDQDARVLLRSHVHRLRHKLELALDRPVIQNVRGSGYTLVAGG